MPDEREIARKKQVYICKRCRKDFVLERPERSTRYCSRKCQNEIRNFKEPDLYEHPLSSGTSGAISELVVCAKLLAQGWAVFRSQSPSCSVDIVAAKMDKVRFIEIRTGRIKRSGHKSWPKTIRKGAVKATEIAVYFPQTNEVEFYEVLQNGG